MGWRSGWQVTEGPIGILGGFPHRCDLTQIIFAFNKTTLASILRMNSRDKGSAGKQFGWLFIVSNIRR